MFAQRPNRQRNASTASLVAPVGGLNARDAIANMKETEAPIMTNWFPTPSDVAVRNGYDAHATGLPSAVDTLMTYSIGSTNQMWAISGGSIYNVTSSGAVGAAAVTGLSSSRFQSVTFGTAGGYYLMAVNGQDDLQYYNGTTWGVINALSVPAITGVATSDLVGINNFKNRLFFIEENTLKVWYLPVASIGGVASALDLSGLFRLGGYLTCMANWTIDNAAGVDDYAAFVTSEGEVALYKGTNPADADFWALVGTFRIGKPIGRRCAIKAGADVLLLTTDGAFPLSKALLTDRSQLQTAITDKITNLISADINSYSSNFGWEPILYPNGNKLIINIPSVEDSMSYQYVMNTITGAWCKFTGWNAFCWAVFDDQLFFGGSNVVDVADSGFSDKGADIETDVQQAFSYFGAKGQQKRFTMARPIFMADGVVNPAIVMNVDYQTRVPLGSPSFSGGGAPLWDIAPWDTSDWGVGDAIIQGWQSVTGVGYCGGLRVQTSTQGINVRWQSSDVVYEKGGVL